MSVSAQSPRIPAPRPAARSLGVATVGLVTTLALFVTSLLAFLVAPILLFGIALLAYLVLRPRTDRSRSTNVPAGSGPSPHAFGAGTR